LNNKQKILDEYWDREIEISWMALKYSVDRKELFKMKFDLIESEKNRLINLLNERIRLLEEYYFNECKIIQFPKRGKFKS